MCLLIDLPYKKNNFASSCYTQSPNPFEKKKQTKLKSVFFPFLLDGQYTVFLPIYNQIKTSSRYRKNKIK